MHGFICTVAEIGTLCNIWGKFVVKDLYVHFEQQQKETSCHNEITTFFGNLVRLGSVAGLVGSSQVQSLPVFSQP